MVLILCGIFMTCAIVVATRRLKVPVTRAEIVKIESDFELAFPGKKGPIKYKKYGQFKDVGTANYRYVIKDKKGLAQAAGEGIFPNRKASRNPGYKELLKEGKLQGNHWSFVDTRTHDVNFYKWATTAEDPGVKQFYTAIMLERLGYIEEAIKAFYAVAVHFPKTVSYTYYNTPWYVGPVAMDRVEQLLRRHPKIKMKLNGGRIFIKNRFDDDTKNDKFTVDPGKLVKKKKKIRPINLSKLKVIKTVGGPKIKLVQYENGHWQLLVQEKPFIIKGITYSVAPVGKSPDRGTWNVARDWQLLDTNKDGVNDGLFESYLDNNNTNKREEDEPIVGDAALLKDLGVNTLRAYHHLYDKELFRKLHKDYGFYVLAGDLLGMYAVGSGAKWEEGTDYSNPKHQKNMLASVRTLVEEYKDEPYILMWVLGNENVYGVANNAGKNPKAFFEFLEKAAQMVKEIDPSRPVAFANGDFLHLDVMAEYAPSIDVIGANAYRGEQGFGRHFFMDVRDFTGRPIIVTEFGCSAIAGGYSELESQMYQAMYLVNNWEDMMAHRAGFGVGNALGGVLFEFIDEWWKANSDLPPAVQKRMGAWYTERSAKYKDLQPENHDAVPQFGFPFLDGWSYEEWYGLVSQGSGEDSPYSRFLRPSYYAIKNIWNN